MTVRKKGGSEKRQRLSVISIRLDAEERARAKRLADKAGLALGAFARAAMLENPGPRAQRRAPADKDALLRILGHLGKLGSNVNQIARRLNLGEKAHLPSLEEALGAYLQLRNAIYEALGLDPTSRKPDALPPDGRSPHGHKRRKPGGA